MKPFIKWVGGKTQIIEDVLGAFPSKMRTYHDVFVGGGSVLLSVLSRGLVSGKVYAYDLNGSLIALYKNIQSCPEKVHSHLKKLYDECTGSEETYYYRVRQNFNTDRNETPERSATFIFLNKMCFRGLYREGPNGFNVPYGHYKTTPTMITLDELIQVRELIKDVHFKHCDFREAFKNMKKGDFVYLDPPYAPESKTSFVGYTKDGFGLTDHEELFELTKNSGIDFVMSNANVDLVRNAFYGYTIRELEVRRAINSKKPGSKTTEVLVQSMV